MSGLITCVVVTPSVCSRAPTLDKAGPPVVEICSRYTPRGCTISTFDPTPAGPVPPAAEPAPIAAPPAPPVALEPELEPEPPAPKRPRRIGWIIAITLLSLALVATGAVLAISLIRLDEAKEEIQKQQELIDKKETFAAAAAELMATTAKFDGSPYSTLVDVNYHESLISRGWQHRWNGGLLDRDTEAVKEETVAMAAVLTAAEGQAAANSTGTFFEQITDQLGSGYVKTSLDTADSACEQDVLGCVSGEDSFTIHYDAAETNGQPYFNDWLRTGLAYHEYAHVLQQTNPEATETAAEAFGGNWETMADCYSLTFLPGWTLDHTIWVSDFEYWEVSMGYGYTCDENQRQVVRDWVGSLGYTHEPISQ